MFRTTTTTHPSDPHTARCVCSKCYAAGAGAWRTASRTRITIVHGAQARPSM